MYRWAMYIGRVFNNSYTTAIEIIKLQKKNMRVTLIAGLRNITNERIAYGFSQSINEVRQES